MGGKPSKGTPKDSRLKKNPTPKKGFKPFPPGKKGNPK